MSTVEDTLSPDDGDDNVPVGRSLEYHFSADSPRILVVDDERVIREILSDFLSLEGYIVRTVEDGAEALRSRISRCPTWAVSS